jgi:hypothetical protein
MKYLAASVPRAVRVARLGHLRMDAIIGMWHIANPGGGFQVFDVVMQVEADFLRTKNHLAAPAVNPAMNQASVNAPYVLREIKEVEAPDVATAAAHFKKEFKTA